MRTSTRAIAVDLSKCSVGNVAIDIIWLVLLVGALNVLWPNFRASTRNSDHFHCSCKAKSMLFHLSIFRKVSNYVDWIEDNTEDACYCS